LSSPAARSPRAHRPAQTYTTQTNGAQTNGAQPRSGQARGSQPRSAQSRPARAPKAPPVRPRNVLDDLPIQIVATDNLPSFSELGLPEALATALIRRGLLTPFPIQAATIPDALAGRDVLGRAATGSGKTLAFGLPLIARLEGRGGVAKRPRALVLVPTRELAMQVTDALDPLAHARDLRVRLIAGGLPIGKQIHQMSAGVDILVATPGRLVDLLERHAVSLDSVEITVLDEADHMADLGFLPVVRRLLDLTPPDGQRLLFSATLDGDVSTLVEHYLKNPVAHALASAEAAVDTMSHHVFRVDRESTPKVITEIAARDGRTILFVRTKHGADRLQKQLARSGVNAGTLHGGRSQSQRTKALDSFKEGRTTALVATDVAARGIHVDGISLVVHVDPPADGKDYLHRSGRTARAGASGIVVSLILPDEVRTYERMLRDSSVPATFTDVRPGSDAVARITGAREPSGVPILEVKQAPARPNRAPRTGRPEFGDRSRSRAPHREGGRPSSPSASASAAVGSNRPRRASGSPSGKAPHAHA
jgi:superfamily II DNA/RNA helicase